MTHSKFPWKLREHPANPNSFIVWAERNNPDEPYDIEVLGEDTGPLYPVEQRRADAEFIIKATEAAVILSPASFKEIQDRIIRALRICEQKGNVQAAQKLREVNTILHFEKSK